MRCARDVVHCVGARFETPKFEGWKQHCVRTGLTCLRLPLEQQLGLLP